MSMSEHEHRTTKFLRGNGQEFLRKAGKLHLSVHVRWENIKIKGEHRRFIDPNSSKKNVFTEFAIEIDDCYTKMIKNDGWRKGGRCLHLGR